ncbi:hypothetical protein [Amycolatopsis aidingensis]|uniref:hypothetical protein n=1 Tax=Amycolatopsis aidingensis TaxID=2842453 RepID=UPI001C0C92AB|nr:hypothetical protein [Amycolatopsis aidingensis]
MSTYGLHRYAASPEEPVPVDSDGFLKLDSKSGVVPVSLLPTLSRNFALLAAGGAGKTTTTTALVAVEPDAEYVETPLETRDKLENLISGAAGTKKTLYFDALDEAVASDQFILRWLARELGRPGAADGYWRLSCRAAAWDRVFATSLPDFKTWKLLPLDRVTAAAVVGEAVGAADFDGAAFIEAAAAAGLGRLSGCLSQLIAVARFWHGRGVLPDTAVEAMEYEVAHLLQETNSQRLRDLPADRAMRIAMRLAAFETFSGTQAFAVSTSGAPSTLTVDQLPSEPEPVETARAIDPADYRDVLDTALFDTGPAGAVVFRHQSYVEYSTAAYLVERKLQPGQVPALLGVHSNGLLPTSRLGVAAWLGALQPGLVESLVHANALMFASSGAATELPSDAIRAAVVAALLDHAASGKIHTDWRVDPALLVHTSLEAELSQSLKALQRSQQLWWIARLAAAGQCTGLAAALVEAAVDTQWYPYARRATVIAVGELGDNDIITGLASILDQDEDPDHQVRAAVIDVLYPKLMSTRTLLAALRPRSSYPVGYDYYYSRSLGELADRIPPTDLPLALDWLRQLDDKSIARRYDRFVEGLLRQAWEHSDDTAVRQMLARMLVSASWRLQSREGRTTLPWIEREADRRHSLVLEMAAIQEDSWQAIILMGLLGSHDVEWLLDEVDTCPPSTAASLAECLARIQIVDMTAALADRLLSLQPSHPAYDATHSLRGSVDMSSEIAQFQRKHAVAMQKAAEARTQAQEQAKLALNNALTHVDVDPGSWWQIPVLVQQARQGDAAPSGGHDLTAWPGWNELQPEDAAKVVDTGIRYLEAHTPNPATWTPLISWTSDQVMPDWAGVYLLTTLVWHYPNKLSDVQLDVWRRWISAIVAVPVFAGDDPDDLRGLLLDAIPTELRPVLADHAINHLEVLHAAGEHLSAYGFYQHVVLEFADRMVAWLLDVSETSPTADELLSLVVRASATETALDLCHRLRNEPDSPLAARAKELLPGLDPNSALDELTSADHTSAQVAAVVSRINSAGLDHDHVLSAARLLLDTFPYHNDPPMRSGAVEPEDTARRLRSNLLQQLASAGRVDDLFTLLAHREDIEQQILGQYLATARARQADLAVKAISPQTLLDLLRSADARLVRDDADLLTVILHQLDNLQHHLTHSTAFQEIWGGNIPHSEDSITDWVKRRLKDRLSEGVVVDREVQAKRVKPKGVGTRIDGVATTFTETKGTARVLFEAKLANNSEVLTAMRAQLIDRYLIPEGRRHGILLIYWIHPDRRPSGRGWPKNLHPDKDALRATLKEQADAELKNGFHITPVILDITPPEGFAGKDNSKPKHDNTTDSSPEGP